MSRLKECIGKLFVQDNVQSGDVIKIEDFRSDNFRENDLEENPNKIMQDKDSIIKPLIILDEQLDEEKVPKKNISSVGLAMVMDSNLSIVENLQLGKSLFSHNEEIVGSSSRSYLDRMTKSNIIASICNAIFETACMNMYSLYDISDFGWSEIGGYFDIKRRFFDKMQHSISIDDYNNRGVLTYINDFVDSVSFIHSKDKDIISDPNRLISTGNMITDRAVALIDATAIGITQAIGNIMAMSVHEGLSTLLCDVVGIPNREMIFDVLAANSKYLQANRNARAYGEIATIYIEEYYYSKIYSMCINVICPNIKELLKNSILSFPFMYVDIYNQVKEDLNNKK